MIVFFFSGDTFQGSKLRPKVTFSTFKKPEISSSIDTFLTGLFLRFLKAFLQYSGITVKNRVETVKFDTGDFYEIGFSHSFIILKVKSPLKN